MLLFFFKLPTVKFIFQPQLKRKENSCHLFFSGLFILLSSWSAAEMLFSSYVGPFQQTEPAAIVFFRATSHLAIINWSLLHSTVVEEG